MINSAPLGLDHLRIERALSGTLPEAELNFQEKDFCNKYRPAFDIGRLAQRMAQGYFSHCAAIELLKDPRATSLVSAFPDQSIFVGYVYRKNGAPHIYNSSYYLDYASSDRVADDLARVWIVGSLLAVGDAIHQCKNINRTPLLELLRHLRNGVAHGNVFEIRDPKELKKNPAHNKDAAEKAAIFEIVPNLDGQPVLFDFMGPGDVIDLLVSIEIYLTRIRERVRASQLGSVLKSW
jgi:hypothetical protein